MQLGYVILYVPDVAASLAFYEQAFGLKRRFLHESGSYGEMETGATALAFAAESLAAANGARVHRNRADADPGAIEIALVTPDVDGAYRRAVAAGATPCKPPADKPWGQRVAFLRDRDGCLVELCTPVKS